MSWKEKEKSGPEELLEATLFVKAQAGCLESVDQLLRRHERLVHYVTQRQHRWGLGYEEAVQAGRQGLWRAILNYDPQRGTPFASYASVAIMRYIWAAVQSHWRQVQRAVPVAVLCLYVYQEGCDPAVLCEWAAVCQCLRALVARLPPRLRMIVRARYGLDGEAPQTLQALADQLGLTRERVRQLQCEALVWLRQPAHSQELRTLLQRHSQPEYEWAQATAQAWLRRRAGRHG